MNDLNDVSELLPLLPVEVAAEFEELILKLQELDAEGSMEKFWLWFSKRSMGYENPEKPENMTEEEFNRSLQTLGRACDLMKEYPQLEKVFRP